MSDNRGFTLLELLLAIAVFALVTVIGYGAYRATVSNLARVESEGEAIERSAAILGRLAEELASLVFDGEVFFMGETASYPGGRCDRLEFLGNSPLLLDTNERRPGPVLIAYRTEREQDSGLLTLYRSEGDLLPGVVPGQGPTRSHLLARGLKEIRFAYHRDDGAIDQTWQARGEKEQGQGGPPLPRAVTIELIYPASDTQEGPRRFSLLAPLPDGRVR